MHQISILKKTLKLLIIENFKYKVFIKSILINLAYISSLNYDENCVINI